MTSKRSPNKRNLGPVIALTGAGIAVAAVIAGFIAVGGPGDARDQRLDQMSLNRVSQVIGIAQCAFNATGATSATIEEAQQVRSTVVNPGFPAPLCGGDLQPDNRITTGDTPAAPGDVTYRATDATHIKVCGNFRRSVADRDMANSYVPLADVYPQLVASHPSGVHCFDIGLVKTDLTADPKHEGHMTIIE